PPYSGILTENFYHEVPSDVTVEVNYRIHGSLNDTFWTTDIVCQSAPLGDDLTSHLFGNPDLEVLAVEIFAAASATAEKTPQPEGFPSFVSLQFHDALQFANFIPAGEDYSFFVDVKALAGSIDLTGACNVNVNNLGAAAGCSHNLA